MNEDPTIVRRAAALMRQRATDAYPGPWISDENENCWRLHSAPDPHWPTMQILKAPKRHNCPQYEEYWPDTANGEHIVSWHPGVALVVAAWLETWADVPWDRAASYSEDQAAAWRIAKAYLGEENGEQR